MCKINVKNSLNIVKNPKISKERDPTDQNAAVYKRYFMTGIVRGGSLDSNDRNGKQMRLEQAG
jgi:hypothetical protein